MLIEKFGKKGTQGFSNTKTEHYGVDQKNQGRGGVHLSFGKSITFSVSKSVRVGICKPG